MKIAGLQKLTLLDYPGKTACTVFTWGCNLRCPFCHNAGLVTEPFEAAVTPEELYAFLKKRIGILDGVALTGGEPLLQPDLIPFLEPIHDMGFLIKLDTNGLKSSGRSVKAVSSAWLRWTSKTAPKNTL